MDVELGIVAGPPTQPVELAVPLLLGSEGNLRALTRLQKLVALASPSYSKATFRSSRGSIDASHEIAVLVVDHELGCELTQV